MRTAFLRCKGRGDHHDKPIAPLAFRRRASPGEWDRRLSARCDSLMGRSAIQRGPRRRNRHLPRSAAIATKERVAAGQSSGDGRRGPSGGSSQSGAGLCRSDAGPAIAAVTVPGGVQKAAEAGKIQRKASAKATVASAARSPAKASARRDVVATGALPIAPRVERRFSEAAPGYRRIRSVREALDAGLTVTRVRTFELPDGRRIEVESEPDPRTSLDLVVRPY